LSLGERCFAFSFRRWGGGRYIAVYSGWVHAATRLLVEHQGSGASLKTWVSSLAGPVSLARLAQGHVGVRVVLAERMFLAASNVLGPITSVSFFVVK